MSKPSKKVLVHYFKVAVPTDPTDSNMETVRKELETYGTVTYLRSVMKSSGEKAED
jgi:hypothetical protein